MGEKCKRDACYLSKNASMKMNNKSKRMIRDTLRLFGVLLFIWLHLPHLVVYNFSKDCRVKIISDLERMRRQTDLNLPTVLFLLYMLHTNSYYRTLFYHRVGPIRTLLIGWYRPGDKYFQISATARIGKGMLMAHPYAIVINAESIGDNFSCIH